MNTPQTFLHAAEAFLNAQDTLAAGFYAESAFALHGKHDGSNADNTLSKSIDTFVERLPKPLAHYTQLLKQAKLRALETRLHAHAPFSHFLVGAALIADDETLHIGCNVECSSYGLTICAERTALVSAVSHGKKRFLAIAVAADTDELTPPCGACRQLLYDFAPDAIVVLVNPHGAEKRFTMKELLPEAFTAAFL